MADFPINKLPPLVVSDKRGTVDIPTLQDFIALVRNNGLSRINRFAVGIIPPGLMSQGSWNVRDLALLCEEASFPAKTINTRPLRINGLTEQRAHTIEFGNDITLTFLVDQSWQTRLFFEEWIRHCIGQAGQKDIGLSHGPSREVEFYDNYVSNISIAALAPIGSSVPGTALNGLSSLSTTLLSSAQSFVSSKLNQSTALLKGNLLGKSVSGLAANVLGIATNALLPIPRAVIPEIPNVPAEIALYNILLYEVFPKAIEAQPMSSSSSNQFHRLKVTFAYKYYTTAQQLPETTNTN